MWNKTSFSSISVPAQISILMGVLPGIEVATNLDSDKKQEVATAALQRF